ncbi:hypothetical protein BOTCAL_0281g00030 [Botryotinia calthae]|uniref:Uncharacterized protein n=1 Tax=Botryotinia calthae TaxID=38488 RepID=A0A4Y8CVB5_9HELO|nr:hypothetical protein BOTCAL_0281g00030 [Botryotinia calthae]
MERRSTNILFGETIFGFDNRLSDVLKYGSIGFLENLEGELPSSEELAKRGGKDTPEGVLIDELVDRLCINKHKPVFSELVKLQKDLRQKTVDEREGSWRDRLTDDQMAEEDAKRFLLENSQLIRT